MTLRMAAAGVGALVVLGGGASSARAGFIPSIEALGSVPGNIQSGNPHLSADGSAAAGYAGATSATREPFRWTAGGGMSALPDVTPVPADEARALGISGDGQTVVGNYRIPSAGYTRGAFSYSAQTGLVTPINNPFASASITATAVTFDGSTIVGELENSSSSSVGFKYTAAGGVQLLTTATSGNVEGAYAITPDGAFVVGGWLSSGYRLSAAGGGLVSLSFPARAVSNDGSVVVGYKQILNPLGSPTLTDEAFVWRQATGQTVSLGDLPGGTFRSQAMAVSADGSIILGSSASSFGDFDAFIWDAQHGMRRLEDVLQNDYGIDMSGWTLTHAQAISADGQYIAGSAFGPSGGSTAWIAHIPEPASAAALSGGLALATATAARRRRRRMG